MKAPDDFTPMTKDLKRADDETDGADNKELWLVTVPQGFDVSALNKVDLSMLSVSGGSQTLKVKTDQEKKLYSMTSFRDASDCKKMSTVVADAGGQSVLGRNIQHMMVVTQMASNPVRLANHPLLAPKQPIPMPTGLRVRFSPFGAGTPCPSVSGTLKKKKKKRHSEQGVTDLSTNTPPSSQDSQPSHSRKRKRDTSPSEVTSPKKKKSKSEHLVSTDVHSKPDNDSHVADNGPTSPTKNKKHKKKSRKSGAVPNGNCDDMDTSAAISPSKPSLLHHLKSEAVLKGENNNNNNTHTSAASPSKHKKHKKKSRRSEEDAQDSSFVDNLFVMDRSGDHVQTKHKKKSRRSEEDIDTSFNGDSFMVDRSGDKMESKPKKKSRKSKGDVADSCFEDSSLSMDTTGNDLENDLNVSTTHKKHKKKKSKKEHRDS